MEKGADVNSRSNDGTATLGHAISHGCLDAAEGDEEMMGLFTKRRIKGL